MRKFLGILVACVMVAAFVMVAPQSSDATQVDLQGQIATAYQADTAKADVTTQGFGVNSYRAIDEGDKLIAATSNETLRPAFASVTISGTSDINVATATESSGAIFAAIDRDWRESFTMATVSTSTSAGITTFDGGILCYAATGMQSDIGGKVVLQTQIDDYTQL